MIKYKHSAIKNWRNRSAKAAAKRGYRQGSAVALRAKSRLDDQTKQAIYTSHQEGISVQHLAKRYRRTQTTVQRLINELRARRLQAEPLGYIYHESFDNAALEAEILGPMPDAAGYEAKRLKARNSAPHGTPPELAGLYETPLLTREQEAHLFRQMNFLKHKAGRLLAQVASAKARGSDLDQIEGWLAQAHALKNQLISANLRLVVSVAKKYSISPDHFFDRLSDGNMSLMRAIEKFDFGRGFKFSTYATWAIMNNFARGIPGEKQSQSRFLTGQHELFSLTPDVRSDEHEALASAQRAQQQVKGLLDRLDERERRIVRLRTGIEAERGLTLAQVGEELGITKERVRQLEMRAMKKLRDLAVEHRLEVA